MVEQIMMRQAVFPARYVQGPGALGRFGSEAARIGTRIYGIVDAGLPDGVIDGLNTIAITLTMERVAGACTELAIASAAEAAMKAGADAIAGFGGGKTIDLARATADKLNLPFISIPTVAASDAPCSALAVIYDEEGHVLRDQFVRWNPQLVLVDSTVISAAPVRLFIAGIGDALATYEEAIACYRSGASNMTGGAQTRLAMAVAETCRATLFEHGAQAVADCRASRSSEAFEAVLEATVLMSGVGFESGGVAAAHAIHHGLAALAETHHMLHGEKVAFGVLVELALNDADDETLAQYVAFNRSVGLPATLGDLGIINIDEALTVIIERATRAGEIIYNEPVAVTPIAVEAAILRANKFGDKE
ncbi:glycerol dehydrogenase [Lentibacter sp. XHP0401]|uniref:glycerol dehydrogenase n=1 Tax=Lentibacter sp. XHP0401 TaxID=2984334 RepID=UPI0021E8D3FA|nr:glycerol dehydrogenase [Lentibacter sp. XHP0401]MCV2894657.1 glycerol dehydrogenase [Lentibacter sp. XHP0401]